MQPSQQYFLQNSSFNSKSVDANYDYTTNANSADMFSPEFVQTQNLPDAISLSLNNQKFTCENNSSNALESICTVSSLSNTTSLPTQALTKNCCFSTQINDTYAQNCLNYNFYQFQNDEKINLTLSDNIYPKKIQYLHPQNNITYNHEFINQYTEY